MSTAGGPKLHGIGRTGDSDIVLCFDCTLAASYPGDPVTNMYGDISTSSNLRPDRTEYNTSAGWRSVAGIPMCPDPTIGRIYKHTSGALTSTWSGNSYGYTLKDLATDSGSTYILTCWVYISEDCDITGLPCSIEGYTSISAVTNYSQYYEMGRKGTWQLLAVKCVADSNVRFIPIYPRKTGVTDGSFSGFYMWGGACVSKMSYVTPYILSSRSATGGWKDLSGNENDGDLMSDASTASNSFRDGSVVYRGNIDRSNTVSVNYLDFDGTDDWISLPNDIGYTDAVSVFAWVKRDTNTGILGGYHIICGTSSLELSLNESSNYLRNGIEVNGTRYVSNDGSTIGTGTWHYVGFTWSTSDYSKKSYVDGVNVGTQSTGSTGTSSYSFSGRSLGMWGGASYALNGKIAAYQVYDTALTTQQVKQNFNSQRSRFQV